MKQTIPNLWQKWKIINDNSNANHDVGNEMIYYTEVLKSNLCDYNDGYILVKGDITVTTVFVQIVLKKQEIYGFLQKMKQLISIITLQILILLSLSSIRIHY